MVEKETKDLSVSKYIEILEESGLCALEHEDGWVLMKTDQFQKLREVIGVCRLIAAWPHDPDGLGGWLKPLQHVLKQIED